MKAIVQRVLRASVSVDGKTVGKIEKGFTVLVGIGKGDGIEKCRAMAEKISKLRIFSDENGKTNLSLKDVNGKILAISQFTLFADCSHGNRPNFLEAAPPDMANELYESFCESLSKLGFSPEKGVFGGDMKIDMLCDGPFTVSLEI